MVSWEAVGGLGSSADLVGAGWSRLVLVGSLKHLQAAVGEAGGSVDLDLGWAPSCVGG